MKKLFLTTLLVIGYLVIAVAQKDTINVHCTTVIAVNGLNIRSQPNISAEILGKIPFGHSIKYLSNFSFGEESINDNRYLGWTKEYIDLIKNNYIFTGKWAKVNYNGITGYVLDTYLFYPERVVSYDTLEYAIVFQDINCYKRIVAPTKFNWYGLFSNSNGSYELKKVDINYFSIFNSLYNEKELGLSTSNDKGLLIIIGSKSKMKEGERKCVNLATLRDAPLHDFNKKKVEYYGLVRNSDSREDQRYHIKGAEKGKFTMDRNKKKITLFNGEVDFIGDIDGDNQWDYVLNTARSSGYEVLYLSSKKKGTNPVGPVAYSYVLACYLRIRS